MLQSQHKYIREIQNIPKLSKDEEFKLANEWIQNKNSKAMHKLVQSHLKLVVHIAKGYSGYGIPLHELVAEGNIGMLQAVNHFDPELGFRLSTYSTWWIKARIQDYIFNAKSIVKFGSTKAHKKLFFCLNKAKRMLGIEKASDENAHMLAEALDIKAETIIDADNRLSSSDLSLNAPISEGESATWEELVADEKSLSEESALHNVELEKQTKKFLEAISTLPKREQDIITWHHLSEPPLTLSEIGAKLNISKERVRQLDQRAITKIKQRFYAPQ